MSAVFDDTRTYRYRLTREVGPEATRVCWVMLNPSTADEVDNDPTIRRCEGFTRAWGFGSLDVVNLFAFRSTKPRGLTNWADDPVGPDNDKWIKHAALAADLVLCAWGAWPGAEHRGRAVVDALLDLGVDLFALATTKTGAPGHPLYLRKELEPFVWQSARHAEGRHG